MTVTLTPHQQQALDWLVTRVIAGDKLLALRGLAGTGKTTLIPALQDALAEQRVRTTIGAPTHRAAMLLRQKGIDNADTIHSHALTPYFTVDYAQAARWLGEEVSCKWEQDPHPDVDGLPWLVRESVLQNTEHAYRMHRHRGRIKAKKLLANLGIHGKDCFAGFGPKAGQGLLIIDESSMVGKSMLALCQAAYPQVLLIGDPGQLPPVKDEAMLAQVPGMDLTEIHRQAADSPIIQLAYRARQGEAFWRERLTALEGSGLGGAVLESAGAEASVFLDSPLIVWRNMTRITCTHEIRHALGYEKMTLMPGEPLVCRTTSQEDRLLGFYNNGLYRIVTVDTHDPRLVTVADALGEAQTITVHLEEVDGEQIPYQAIPFRWGYCLTAHTAQGGEWPTVYISRPDLLKYASAARTPDRQAAVRQWTYTAITRAKETLCFLTQHTFERTTMAPKMTPQSAPILASLPDDVFGETSPQAEIVSVPPIPVDDRADDDIQDPPVPPEALTMPQEASRVSQAVPDTLAAATDSWAAHEALLVGFCEAWQNRMRTWLVQEASALDRREEQRMILVKDWLQTIGTANEHASYQLSSSLDALLTHGLAVLSPPLQVTVQAVSPQGFPVVFTITKPGTPDGQRALVGEADPDTGFPGGDLPRIVRWLQSEGYTTPVAATAF